MGDKNRKCSSTSLLIREIQIKMTMRLKLRIKKRLITTNVVQQQELSHSTSGTVQVFWKSVWVFLKVKFSPTTGPWHYSSRYLPKRNKSICTQEDLYVNVHRKQRETSYRLNCVPQIFICRSPNIQNVTVLSKGFSKTQSLSEDNGVGPDRSVLFQYSILWLMSLQGEGKYLYYLLNGGQPKI